MTLFDDRLPAREKYADIIDMPRHRSETRQPMSALDRAAQFAPFAALTGYDERINEAARYTEVETCLDEDRKLAIDAELQKLGRTEGVVEVSVSYFVRDIRKAGGRYCTAEGTLRRVDENRGLLVLENITVPFEDIRELDYREVRDD